MQVHKNLLSIRMKLPRGISTMAVRLLPKQETRVRFSYPALILNKKARGVFGPGALFTVPKTPHAFSSLGQLGLTVIFAISRKKTYLLQ